MVKPPEALVNYLIADVVLVNAPHEVFELSTQIVAIHLSQLLLWVTLKPQAPGVVASHCRLSQSSICCRMSGKTASIFASPFQNSSA